MRIIEQQSVRNLLRMNNAKPKLVIDVDGVLLNFTTAFADWWNDKYYQETGHKCPYNPKDWHFEYPNQSVVIEKIKEYIDERPHFELMENSIPSVMREMRKNYEIHLVTAYPEDHADTRVENLLNLGIEFDDIYFVDGHKMDIVKMIDPLAVIEDSPKNVKDITGIGYKVFVPSRWNYSRLMIENNNDKVFWYHSFEEFPSLLKQ